MSLTFAETQAVGELAEHLYDYLPGSSYGNRAYTFADAAREARVQQYWHGGSKEPAIASLLELTLDQQRGPFCPLIEAIVRAGLKYRAHKGNPMTSQDLAELNRLILAFGFKIASLWVPIWAVAAIRRHHCPRGQGSIRTPRSIQAESEGPLSLEIIRMVDAAFEPNAPPAS